MACARFTCKCHCDTWCHLLQKIIKINQRRRQSFSFVLQNFLSGQTALYTVKYEFVLNLNPVHYSHVVLWGQGDGRGVCVSVTTTWNSAMKYASGSVTAHVRTIVGLDTLDELVLRCYVKRCTDCKAARDESIEFFHQRFRQMSTHTFNS